MLAVAVAALAAILAPIAAAQTSYAATGLQLHVSQQRDRSASAGLDGRTFGADSDIYVFVTDSPSISRVTFWVDDPRMEGRAYQIENNSPWDVGGGEVAKAKPLDTGDLAPGPHTVTARADFPDGASSVVTATFIVTNGPVSVESEPEAEPESDQEPNSDPGPERGSEVISPEAYFAVSSSPDRSSASKLTGSAISGHAYIFLKTGDNVDDVSFWLDDPRRLGPSYQSEDNSPFDLAGGSVSTAHAWNSRDIADGDHLLSAVLTMTDDSTRTLETSFVVANSAFDDPGDDGLKGRPAPPPASAPGSDPVPAPVPAEGEWPAPDSTGVPVGTSLTKSGSITVTTDGAVIDAMEVSGTIAVKANNVTIKRTRVTNNPGSDAWTVRLYSDHTGLVIEDSELDGGGGASVAVCCGDFTLRGVDIRDSVDGVRADGNVLIEDSYIHDLARTDGSHNDTIQTLKGENITIRHNTLLPYDAKSGDPMNAAYIISAGSSGGPVGDVTFAYNYVDGGNYTLYMGDGGEHPVTDVTVIGNVFGRNFRYGPVSAVTDNAYWENNVFADTGEPVR